MVSAVVPLVPWSLGEAGWGGGSDHSVCAVGLPSGGCRRPSSQIFEIPSAGRSAGRRVDLGREVVTGKHKFGKHTRLRKLNQVGGCG